MTLYLMVRGSIKALWSELYYSTHSSKQCTFTHKQN